MDPPEEVLIKLLPLLRLLLLLALSAATAAAQHATHTCTHTTSDFYSLKPRLHAHQWSAHSPLRFSLSQALQHINPMSSNSNTRSNILGTSSAPFPPRPLCFSSHAMLSLRLFTFVLFKRGLWKEQSRDLSGNGSSWFTTVALQ